MALSHMSAGNTSVVPDYDIDRQVFRQEWKVYALPVPPKFTQDIVTALKGHVLRVPRIQTVEKSPTGASDRLVLLRYFSTLPPEMPSGLRGNMELESSGNAASVAEKLSSADIVGKVGTEVVDLLKGVTGASLLERDLSIGYDHWSMEAVLSRLLPNGTTMYAWGGYNCNVFCFPCSCV